MPDVVQPKLKATTAFIDGFNLYHAIDDLEQGYLKWVNLVLLSSQFLEQSWDLKRVYLFTSYTTWDVDKHARHQQFVNAQIAKGVTVCLGKFHRKEVDCRAECKQPFAIRVEKQTDVNIAVSILDDAHSRAYECGIVISADSDLAPAIQRVKRHYPGILFKIVTPPGREVSRELARANGDRDPKWKMVERWYPRMTVGDLSKCLLDKNVVDKAGNVRAVRPIPYDPPA